MFTVSTLSGSEEVLRSGEFCDGEGEDEDEEEDLDILLGAKDEDEDDSEEGNESEDIKKGEPWI